MKLHVSSEYSSQYTLENDLNLYCRHLTGPNSEHPFTSLEWLRCWLYGFSSYNDCCLYGLKQGESPMAVLPMVSTRVPLKHWSVSCLSYPGNGHSPRGDIPAVNAEARNELLRLAMPKLFKQSPLIVFPGLLVGSSSWQAVRHLSSDRIGIRTECRYEAPGFFINKGWGSYFSGLPKKSRDRIKNNFSRARRQGSLSHCFSDSNEDGHNSVFSQLEKIDSASWQGKAGSGLFSTSENRRFYSKLLNNKESLRSLICLTMLDQHAIAYSIALLWHDTAYILKMGYDEAYSSISPGVITSSVFFEKLDSLGVKKIDFGAGTSVEKSRWEDHRVLYDNLWLIDRKQLSGRLFSAILKYVDSKKHYLESPFDVEV